MDEKVRFSTKDLIGAFSDVSVLFPLAVLLSVQMGFSLATLLISAGILYFWVAFWFRVPLSVQPLKSIVVLGLGLGASAKEIQVAALGLGLVCLFLWVGKIGTQLFLKIPPYWIHGIQLGLGWILLRKAFEIAWMYERTDVFFWSAWIAVAIAGLCLIQKFHVPVLGFVACLGLLWAVVFGEGRTSSHFVAEIAEGFHWSRVLWLLLPQVVLTLFNSVYATVETAWQYFPKRASRVSISRLLISIGFGNVFLFFIGGIPFCHGSGGVTAHVKGGARHWGSFVVMGVVYVGLGILLLFQKDAFSGNYPPFVLTLLLFWVGVFHMGLAKQSFQKGTFYVLSLILMGIVALWTKNLLWVFGVAIFSELGKTLWKRSQKLWNY